MKEPLSSPTKQSTSREDSIPHKKNTTQYNRTNSQNGTMAISECLIEVFHITFDQIGTAFIVPYIWLYTKSTATLSTLHHRPHHLETLGYRPIVLKNLSWTLNPSCWDIDYSKTSDFWCDWVVYLNPNKLEIMPLYILWNKVCNPLYEMHATMIPSPREQT